MLTSYKLWKSICLTNDLSLGNSSGGGTILLITIKIKYHAWQNLEIMTFRYLKTLVFDNFFKKVQHYCMYLFWRLLLVITNPLPSLYDYSIFSHHIHLSHHLFQKNWHDHKKFWRFHQIPPPTPHIVHIRGWCHGSIHPKWITCKFQFSYWQKTFFGKNNSNI